MKLSRRGLLGGLIALPVVGKAVASVVEKAEVVKDTATIVRSNYIATDLMCTAGGFERMEPYQWTPDELSEIRRTQVESITFNKIKP